MSAAAPWSVKGIDPKAREVAKKAKEIAEKKAKDDAKNGGGTILPVAEEIEPEFTPEEPEVRGAEPTADSVFGPRD